MTDNDTAPPAPQHDASTEPDRKSKFGQLFDIRAIIGALFLVYGVLIGAAGVFAGPQAIHKAEGVNINLWTGISMLLVGALFLMWLKLRPLSPETSGGEETESM